MIAKPRRLSRAVLVGLWVLSAFLAGAGLIIAAAIKTDAFADRLLSWNPRYSQAVEGLQILETPKFPLPMDANVTQNVGVLTITDRSWGVILDFMKSETAIRKSERNLPTYPAPTLGSGAPDTKPATPPAPPPEIDFDRIKTVSAIRLDVARAGTQPLAPPYRLAILLPPGRFQDVRFPYEFLSFQEFRLDLRHMILDEMEEWTLWLAVIAFGCSLLLEAFRRLVSSYGPNHWPNSQQAPSDAEQSAVTRHSDLSGGTANQISGTLSAVPSGDTTPASEPILSH
jgi:hypothetical protein